MSHHNEFLMIRPYVVLSTQFMFKENKKTKAATIKSPYQVLCQDLPLYYLSDLICGGQFSRESYESNGARKMLVNAYFHQNYTRLDNNVTPEINKHLHDYFTVNFMDPNAPVSNRPKSTKSRVTANVVQSIIECIIHTRFQNKNIVLPMEYKEVTLLRKNPKIMIQVQSYDPDVFRQLKHEDGKMTLIVWTKIPSSDIDARKLTHTHHKTTGESVSYITADKYTPWWLTPDVENPDFYAAPFYKFVGCIMSNRDSIPDPISEFNEIATEIREPTDPLQEHQEFNVAADADNHGEYAFQFQTGSGHESLLENTVQGNATQRFFGNDFGNLDYNSTLKPVSLRIQPTPTVELVSDLIRILKELKNIYCIDREFELVTDFCKEYIGYSKPKLTYADFLHTEHIYQASLREAKSFNNDLSKGHWTWHKMKITCSSLGRSTLDLNILNQSKWLSRERIYFGFQSPTENDILNLVLKDLLEDRRHPAESAAFYSFPTDISILSGVASTGIGHMPPIDMMEIDGPIDEQMELDELRPSRKRSAPEQIVSQHNKRQKHNPNNKSVTIIRHPKKKTSKQRRSPTQQERDEVKALQKAELDNLIKQLQEQKAQK